MLDDTIDGYVSYRKDRNRQGGGIAWYVNNAIEHVHPPTWVNPKLKNAG